LTALAVVIVAYDSASDLPATLAALRPQLADCDELVVVDNASSDEPANAAGGARVLRLERNLGFAGGCNAGAAITTAPLLFFLNPDAPPAPGCLDALRAASGAHPAWGAWQALVTLPGGAEVNTRGGELHWLGLGWSGGYGEPVGAVAAGDHAVGFASGAALIVRRDAWDAAGGFDPDYFMYGEDVDLSVRLRLAGWVVGVVPAARVEHDYEFAKGAYKWFHLERNRLWTVIGAYPDAVLVLTAPALIGLELALLVVAARGGWLRPKLQAQLAVLRTLPWALRRRRRVQAMRRASAATFAAAMTASLDSPYVEAPVVLERLQAAYWAAVRALLRCGSPHA
jgi:N-acetylglucosaminyl-diphospho-decaprenol L-rhamnosyltransferase